jgi:hypothetical protein
MVLDSDPAETRLVAIGNDGSVGSAVEQASGRFGPIALHATGGADVTAFVPANGAAVLLTFEPVGSDGPRIHRYASNRVDGGIVRGLRAGDYQMHYPGGRRSVRIEPGGIWR